MAAFEKRYNNPSNVCTNLMLGWAEVKRGSISKIYFFCSANLCKSKNKDSKKSVEGKRFINRNVN